ncbi:hypothetical protein BBK82_21750 [Lentzea guizhouensis]|uniref:ABC transporter ATP-binding protein n=1 Tax=Lentzea guizhouensis TaxID=1586287 RepID=A0A1B2HKP6_9PSEU|nr:ATP-binding cassette domain-containing protein [Lentzea guizhouensis]ANZ38298.1 hypothetical protein BBK82_21750 [Lentzea guizhouensis]
MRRIHRLTHRRIAVYLRALVRAHPRGPAALAGFDRLDPGLPRWVEPGRVRPESPDPAPPRPSPEPQGEDVQRFPLRHGTFIGHHEDCQVRIHGYHVAGKHAVIERRGDHWELRDLGHSDGTFQGGRPVRRTSLTALSVFDIADHRFQISKDELELVVTPLGECDLVVHDLSDVTKKDARPRLVEMSLVQRERTVLAVLGPSGAGKSSLFAALLGELETAGGHLYFEGLDVRTHREQLSSKLGFVPQDDSMHRALTVESLLRFADRLRRPSDRRQEGDPVASVCADLGLTEHIGKPVHKLSGGQRKRVSVALEMLSEPKLLMLDEPTSGLDPGMDRDVMEMLAAYADRGGTVALVTHATEHLHLADQVLVLAPGGRPVYCGPPGGVLGTLQVPTYADLMKLLEDKKNKEVVDRLVAEYRAGPVVERAKRAVEEAAARQTTEQEPDRRRGKLRSFLHQLPILVARQVVLTFSWPGGMMPFLIAGIAAVIAAVVSKDGALGAGPTTEATTALSILVTLCVLTGQALSYSNLVEEHNVVVREHRTGTITAAVVLSKWLVFAVIAVVQAVIAAGVFVWWRNAPAHAVTGMPTSVELMFDLGATSVAAMSLGLLISACCKDLKTAVTVTSLVVVAQVALNGVTTDLSGGTGVAFVAALLPARWGLAAAGSTVDLRTISPVAYRDELWLHGKVQWLTDLGWLAGLTAVFVSAAVIVLGRRLR